MRQTVKDDPVPPPHDAPRLCVLASGSAANASALHWRDTRRRDHLWLIDAGLSPRRTRSLLDAHRLSLEHLEGIVLTHLDRDHWHQGWANRWDSLLPTTTRVLLHHTHSGDLPRLGRAAPRAELIRHGTTLDGDATLATAVAPHDRAGSAALRFQFHSGAALGYATDLGRVDTTLVRHLRAVHVLAIESNYCPRLQADSGRPDFLIDRITGGRGHLSNEEARDAVRRIGPLEHVVLLHLSRDCNRPHLAARLHQDSPLPCTVASHNRPTPWIPVGATRTSPTPTPAQLTFFNEHAPRARRVPANA